MSWQPEVDEIAYRRALAAKLGGEDKVARHKAAGKLTVRERIDACTDAQSFVEVGSLTGSGQYDGLGRLTDFTPSNLIMGRARGGGIGRASGRGKGEIPGGAGSFKKKKAGVTCASVRVRNSHGSVFPEAADCAGPLGYAVESSHGARGGLMEVLEEGRAVAREMSPV